jgi:hypothetical protein
VRPPFRVRTFGHDSGSNVVFLDDGSRSSLAALCGWQCARLSAAHPTWKMHAGNYRQARWHERLAWVR